MGAFVEHEFSNGFILDEGRVRKLQEIVSERVARLPEKPEVKFKVFRGDSYSYVTGDVNTVINEDNDDWRAITRLEVTTNAKDVLEFSLIFSDKTSLRILGDDRDIVFLLFSDLREYISKEVMGRRKVTRDFSRTIGLIIMLVATFGMMWTVYSQMRPSTEEAAAALASADVAEKLNFLIGEREQSKQRATPIAGMGLMLLAMVLATTGLLEYVWKVIFPTNLFLFGKRKTAYENRQRLMGNIFWVGVVGALVSIGAGFVVWWFTV